MATVKTLILLSCLYAFLRQDILAEYVYSTSQIVDQRQQYSGRPVVQIPDGELEGFYMLTVRNRPIVAFQAIPYAEPPIKKLRFVAPIRNKPWRGRRDATVPCPICLQADLYNQFAVVGQEDCLYLNVYTRNLPTNENGPLLPVIVAIHGGGMLSGSVNFVGPKILLDEPCVLVSMTYRLGPFGFFTTGDLVVPGNNGIKDQVLALKWIKRNIEYFGGDPSKITILGTSSGSSSVHFHMLSPASRGLFHRAVMQSGSAFSPWALSPDGVGTSKKLARVLNCPTSNSYEMVKCLRSKNATEFPASHPKLLEWAYYRLTLWGLVIEPEHPGAFLTEYPERIYEKNAVARVPILSGINKDEGSLFVSGIVANEEYVTDFNNLQKWSSLVGPVSILLNNLTCDPADVGRIARQIRAYYLGNRELSFSTRLLAVRMFSDRYFTLSTIKAMRYQVRYIGSPVYSYYLTFRGKYSILLRNGLNPADWGVAHQDNDIYLFDSVLYPTVKITDKEYKLARLMTKLWVNFANTGNPNSKRCGKNNYEAWVPNLPSNTDQGRNIRFYELNLNPEMIDNPLEQHEEFWSNLDLIQGPESCGYQEY